MLVPVATEEKNDGTEQEDHGGKRKCEIITIILRSIFSD